MMSDTLISPKADTNIRRRLESYKRKNATPNFGDILRKRCMERLKARRGALLDQLRSINSPGSLRVILTNHIEQDVYESQRNSTLLRSDLDEQSMEVSELSPPLSQLATTDKDKQILEEYERLIEATAEQLAAASELVVCPCCLQGVLSADNQLITCDRCPLSLPARLTVKALEKQLFEGVDCHDQNCDDQPTFIVCPDNLGNSLLMLCSTCGMAHHII